MTTIVEKVLKQIQLGGVESLDGEKLRVYNENKDLIDSQLASLLAGSGSPVASENVYGAMGLDLGNTKGSGDGAPVTVNYTFNNESFNLAAPGAIQEIYNVAAVIAPEGSPDYAAVKANAKAAVHELYTQLKAMVSRGEITQDEANSIYLKSVTGSDVQPKVGKPGAKDGDGNTIIININITTYVYITVTADVQAIIDAMMEAFQDQNDLLANLVAQLIANQNENANTLQEFLYGLVHSFAQQNNMNFQQMFGLLDQIIALLAAQGIQIGDLTSSVTALLNQVLNELQNLRVDTSALVAFAQQNNNQNENTNALLGQIYDLISAFKNQQGQFDDAVLTKINQILSLINALDPTQALSQIIALLQQNNQQNAEIIALLSEVSGKLTSLGNNLTAEMQAGFSAVINAILNNGGGSGGTVDLSQILALLQTIADNTAQSNSLEMQILAAIGALGSALTASLMDIYGTLASFQSQNHYDLMAILAAIQGLNIPAAYDDTQLQAMLAAILSAIQQCCDTCHDDDDPGNNEGIVDPPLYCPGPNGTQLETIYPKTQEGLLAYIADLKDNGVIDGLANGNGNGGGTVGIEDVIDNPQQMFDLNTFDNTTFRIYDVSGRTIKTFKGSQVSNKKAMNTDLKLGEVKKVIVSKNGISAGTLKDQFNGITTAGTYFIEQIK